MIMIGGSTVPTPEPDGEGLEVDGLFALLEHPLKPSARLIPTVLSTTAVFFITEPNFRMWGRWASGRRQRLNRQSRSVGSGACGLLQVTAFGSNEFRQ